MKFGQGPGEQHLNENVKKRQGANFQSKTMLQALVEEVPRFFHQFVIHTDNGDDS